LNLFFSQPAFLGALLLASLPVIIHLVNRRRAIVVRFAAIDFVLRSNRKLARRFKIKQFLLLLFRTLALIALALALARPLLSRSKAIAESGDQPKAVMLVLDTSVGMDYRGADGKLFVRAKKLLRNELDALTAVDAAGLLLCGNGTEGDPQEPLLDRAALRTALRRADRGYRRSDILPCIEQAAEMLDRAVQPVKQITFATDLTKTGYMSREQAPGAALNDKDIILHIIDAGDGNTALNLGVLGASAETVFRSGGSLLEIKAQIGSYASNYSADGEKETVPLVIEAGGETAARGFLELEPGERRDKIFSLPWRDGQTVRGQVEIGTDALEPDNRRYFVGEAAGSISVVMVDGDPGEGPFGSEIFYVEKALSPSRLGNADIASTVTDAAGFDGLDLDEFDVVILANVGEISARATGKLKRFVHGGGGLFVSLGNKIDPENTNGQLGELLPRPIWGEKSTIASDEGGQTITEPAHLDPFRADPEIFDFLREEGQVDLASAGFTHYFQFQSDGEHGSSTLLSFQDGSPALLYREYGQGRVMVFASSVDRQWSNFAIKPVFLPIIRRSCRTLAGNFSPHRKYQLLVGEAIRIENPESENYLVETPDGERIEADASSGSLNFTATDVPGFYNVIPLGGGNRALTFAVNLDPAESDLERLSPEEAAQLLGATNLVVTGGSEGSEAGSGLNRPIWGIFLLLMFLFIGLEGLITILI
jgi:Aerotolerance regulator N-terminal